MKEYVAKRQRRMGNPDDFRVEEISLSVLPPDWISPEQQEDRVRAELSDQPAVRLATAVLAGAIADYQSYLANPSRPNRLLFDAARGWIDSPDLRWVFSFENVCLTLQIDASALRCALEAWRRKAAVQDTAHQRPIRRRTNARRYSIGYKPPRAA